jgi:ATP-dependent Clp protease ATP-binding subunit ClpA
METEESNTVRKRLQQAGMFDKFTEAARRTLVYAQEEARRFKHDYIGTEHLLLGLLRDDQAVAGRALSDLGVTIESGRKALAFINPPGSASPASKGGLTPRAKKAMELGVEEARDLGDRYLGTEHILLGIIREREGLGAGILTGMGLDPDRVRAQVLHVREAKLAAEVPATRANVVSFRLDDRALAALDALVEAGVRNTRSEAAAWLVEAGIAAKQDFFQQVNTTVAQIRALRAQVQSLAQQPPASAPADAAPPPAEDDTPASE